jgi:hypothetical protein
MNDSSAFGATACDSLLRVACCGPVPSAAAIVPFMAPLGRGLLVAFMLSSAGALLLFRGRPAVSSGRGNPSLHG